MFENLPIIWGIYQYEAIISDPNPISNIISLNNIWLFNKNMENTYVYNMTPDKIGIAKGTFSYNNKTVSWYSNDGKSQLNNNWDYSGGYGEEYIYYYFCIY